MRKLVVVGAALCLGLAGCDSATVDSEPPQETEIAPLERESDAPSSSENSASKSQEDRGAREISEIPSAEVPEPDAKYLDKLKDAGVNVDGVEDQLLGAGKAACDENEVTISAVAGQLIEQQRTTMGFEELSQLIKDSARSGIC
ncbi:MAG: DUF732 domain-containing protein [Corynebacterium sp.]|uniref:DUF732 domain-containing protein n=1 Tax=Corynebacterium TaxID=1716 RepID=UPI00066C6BA3|nr:MULTISPECIES: DUF732 domain-containing protein [Corynebacterium]MBS5996910.1 hypothetical protein [Corynebacterium sp.]MCZ9301330.1 DUF732 domain-containing protein [Corynebacterium marquesiae]MDK8668784.1 DUF732 domain-containing protein [Corynebacterium marquesiae]MDU1461167.1 DUF732 domain-containing protein [Corynebacterium sp.]MDU5016541.1 DUF732 domain-containing protein [Corynebacterium sp.]